MKLIKSIGAGVILLVIIVCEEFAHRPVATAVTAVALGVLLGALVF